MQQVSRCDPQSSWLPVSQSQSGMMDPVPWLFTVVALLLYIVTPASSSVDVSSGQPMPGCLARVFIHAGVPRREASLYEKAVFEAGVEAAVVTQKSPSITFYLSLFANMHESHLKLVADLCNSAGGCHGQACAHNGRCRLNRALSAAAANGAASDEQHRYMCSCPGTAGLAVQCPAPDKCRGTPCLNGGACRQLSHHPFYHCACPALFAGVHCQNELDPCESEPCENAGTCRRAPASPHYACSCSVAFHGKNCQHKYAPCHSAPCANGATCRQDTSDPRAALCTCAPGFTGPLCEGVWLTEDHWNSVVGSKDEAATQLNGRFLAELAENALLLAEYRNASIDYIELQTQAMNLSAQIQAIQEENRAIENALHSKTMSLLAQSESILTAVSTLNARSALTYKLYAGGNWSWNQAVSRCRQLGGELVSIRTERQQQQLLGIHGIKHGMSGVWLGARDVSADKYTAEYVWMNGDPMIYTNWARGAPGSAVRSAASAPGQQLCVLMSLQTPPYSTSNSSAEAGAWRTDLCDSESYGYVCEFSGGL